MIFLSSVREVEIAPLAGPATCTSHFYQVATIVAHFRLQVGWLLAILRTRRLRSWLVATHFFALSIFLSLNVCRSVHIIAAMTNKSRCVAQLQLAEGAAFTLWGLGSSPAGDFPFCVLFKPLMSFVFPSCDVHHRYKYLHVYIHTYKTVGVKHSPPASPALIRHAGVRWSGAPGAQLTHHLAHHNHDV